MDNSTVIENCVNICTPPLELVEIPSPKFKKEESTCVRISVSSTDFTLKDNNYEKLPISTETHIQNLLDKLTIKELASLVIGYDYVRGSRLN